MPYSPPSTVCQRCTRNAGQHSKIAFRYIDATVENKLIEDAIVICGNCAKNKQAIKTAGYPHISGSWRSANFEGALPMPNLGRWEIRVSDDKTRFKVFYMSQAAPQHPTVPAAPAAPTAPAAPATPAAPYEGVVDNNDDMEDAGDPVLPFVPDASVQAQAQAQAAQAASGPSAAGPSNYNTAPDASAPEHVRAMAAGRGKRRAAFNDGDTSAADAAAQSAAAAAAAHGRIDQLQADQQVLNNATGLAIGNLQAASNMLRCELDNTAADLARHMENLRIRVTNMETAPRPAADAGRDDEEEAQIMRNVRIQGMKADAAVVEEANKQRIDAAINKRILAQQQNEAKLQAARRVCEDQDFQSMMDAKMMEVLAQIDTEPLAVPQHQNPVTDSWSFIAKYSRQRNGGA